MKAFNWLTRLRSDTSGNVLAIGAAAMPMLIAAAAIGVDTVQLSLWKSQLQRAADSGALAGAYALSQSRDVPSSVNRSITLNDTIAPDTIDTRNAPTAGPFLNDNRAVRVVLTARRNLPFMAFFGVEPPNITVEATARVEPGGDFCMLSLFQGTGAGIDVNGNANVSLGCGMAANARGPSSIESGGSSSITADPLMAVGGIANGQNFVGNPRIIPYGTAQKDPFASVPNPTVPSNCSPETLTPANVPTASGTYCFAAMDIQPSEAMTLPNDTTIIINGGNIDLKGDLTGTRVAFLMTGTDGAAGDLIINSQANIKLTARTDTAYKDILFFRDRRAANIEIKINGGAASKLQGALYFPTSDITFAGHAGMNVKCLQMVGQILKFRGSANISNECEAGSGGTDFTGSIVRLVA